MRKLSFSEICSLPADPGPCTHESQTRWYFDVARGECREFTYGGCVGNHNNFATAEGMPDNFASIRPYLIFSFVSDCRSYCARHSKPYSGGLEKPDLGRPHHNPGPHHFNTHQTTAAPRFLTTLAHRPKPTKVYSPPLIPSSKPSSNLPELCQQQKDPGNCFGDQLQFYYDWDKGKCIAFSYTGCGGNTNRFQSEETCERACGAYRDQGKAGL